MMFSGYISTRIYKEDENENTKKVFQEIRQTLHGVVPLVCLLPQTREDDRSGARRTVRSVLKEEM